VLISFDLIELDGHDLRRERIEHRKARLAKLVRSPHPGIALQARLGGYPVAPPYRSGRSLHWVKVKNPKAPAVIGITIAALLVQFPL
jgi:ATP-dependent DNA ligase